MGHRSGYKVSALRIDDLLYAPLCEVVFIFSLYCFAVNLHLMANAVTRHEADKRQADKQRHEEEQRHAADKGQEGRRHAAQVVQLNFSVFLSRFIAHFGANVPKDLTVAKLPEFLRKHLLPGGRAFDASMLAWLDKFHRGEFFAKVLDHSRFSILPQLSSRSEPVLVNITF